MSAARKKSGNLWVADAIPVMARIEDGNAPRPVLLIITAGNLIIYQELVGTLAGGAEAVAEALEHAVDDAASSAGGLPKRLRLRHKETADAVRKRLRGRGVAVSSGEVPEHIAVVREFVQEIAGYDMWPPACVVTTWDGWDLPDELIREAFSAAADFYRAAPWRHVSSVQAPSARLPSGRTWTCCVLGQTGEEYGLSLHSSALDLSAILAPDAGDQPFERMHGHSITVSLESADAAGATAVRYAREHGLELAGPAAFPTLTTVNSPGGGVSVEDAEDLSALLRALPHFIDLHRVAFELEERTGTPMRLIAWDDPDSGILFRYMRQPTLIDLPSHFDRDMAEETDFGPFAIVDEDLGEEIERLFRVLDGNVSEETLVHELNRLLGPHIATYNTAPQGDLGGLSPAQVHKLLADDWTDPHGVVRLNTALPHEEIGHHPCPQRATALLEHALEPGSLDATQAGYIRPAVVSELIDRMGLADRYAAVRENVRRITERDSRPVHLARVICELAGLIEPTRARFVITPEGRRLTDPACAGELYAVLFRTWFRVFDTGYNSPVDWPELQHQVAFTLYRLPDAAADWRALPDLLTPVVLPLALEKAPTAGLPEFPLPLAALKHMVLEPLTWFGLAERRSESYRIRDDEFRVTPLFSRFIRFELD